MESIKKSILEKKQILNQCSLNKSFVDNLDGWLRNELTYTSNALEGNTLTRQETKLVTEDGLSVGGRSVVEILEIKNHNEALIYIQKLSKIKKTVKLTEIDLLNIHSIILKGINDHEAGKYRSVPVRISGSLTVTPNHMKVPKLMESLFNQINQYETSDENTLELAIKAHYELVSIHPFVDGNGRTARLLFNLILLQNGYPITFIKKEDRIKYLKSLEKAQTGGSNEDYKMLMYKAIERSLDLFLDIEGSEEIITKLYKIGELAKVAKVDISTIRYWSKVGLLKPTNKTAAGYTLYNQETIDLIAQIRHLQTEKRLSIKEIINLLG
jgi:Fic family protein